MIPSSSRDALSKINQPFAPASVRAYGALKGRASALRQLPCHRNCVKGKGGSHTWGVGAIVLRQGVSVETHQFMTTQYMARFLLRSFTVSVFPVPAGPRGFPPRFRNFAVSNVRTQRSVSGVTTNRPLFPWYLLRLLVGYPYYLRM